MIDQSNPNLIFGLYDPSTFVSGNRAVWKESSVDIIREWYRSHRPKTVNAKLDVTSLRQKLGMDLWDGQLTKTGESIDKLIDVKVRSKLSSEKPKLDMEEDEEEEEEEEEVENSNKMQDVDSAGIVVKGNKHVTINTPQPDARQSATPTPTTTPARDMGPSVTPATTATLGPQLTQSSTPAPAVEVHRSSKEMDSVVNDATSTKQTKPPVSALKKPAKVVFDEPSVTATRSKSKSSSAKVTFEAEEHEEKAPKKNLKTPSAHGGVGKPFVRKGEADLVLYTIPPPISNLPADSSTRKIILTTALALPYLVSDDTG